MTIFIAKKHRFLYGNQFELDFVEHAKMLFWQAEKRPVYVNVPNVTNLLIMDRSSSLIVVYMKTEFTLFA